MKLLFVVLYRLHDETEKSVAVALQNARLMGELDSYKRQVALMESHSNSWREHATNVVQTGLIEHRNTPQPVRPSSESSQHSHSSGVSSATHMLPPNMHCQGTQMMWAPQPQLMCPMPYMMPTTMMCCPNGQPSGHSMNYIPKHHDHVPTSSMSTRSDFS